MGNKIDFIKQEKFMNQYSYHLSLFHKKQKVFKTQHITFPLSTSNAAIVDAKGKRVKLAGTNWSGAHMARHCVDGLECRPLKDIVINLRDKFRMNCIRLTYSLQMFYEDNVIPQNYIAANLQLKGKTAMQVFDYTIQTITKCGVMIILNNHTSKSQWCCSNEDGDGLWWSRQYPQYMFFQCAEIFAARYKNNPLVIGTDLRNQLRKAHNLEANWGNNDPRTDWYRASKICAERVLKIAPHWLIFLPGLNYQLDLTCFAAKPLQLSIPNKLVCTGHQYSWSWLIQPSSFEQFDKKMFNTMTFVRGKGIPFLLGEFGNNKRDNNWNYLIKYLQQYDLDFTYWCCDGFKCVRNDDQSFGLFTNDFMNIRNPDIYQDLMKIVNKKN